MSNGLTFTKDQLLDPTIANIVSKSPKVGNSVTVSWSNCTKSTDGAVVDQVTWTPNPPILGKNLTITAIGEVKSETVRVGSNYTLTMKYGSVEVLQGSYPLCGDSTVDLPLGLGTIILQGLNCPQVELHSVLLMQNIFMCFFGCLV